jgi:hypothetical protein
VLLSETSLPPLLKAPLKFSSANCASFIPQSSAETSK